MDTWDITEIDVRPHRPQVLRSDRETRAIAITLPDGEELQQHQVHERAWLVVVAGEVKIDDDGGAVRGGPGLVAHFEPNERRTVRATADARLVLLLSPWPGEGHPSRHA